MRRTLTLTIGLAVLTAGPVAAFAQARPAAIASGSPAAAPRTVAPRFTTIERKVVVLRPPGKAPTQPGAARRQVLTFQVPNRLADIPQVELRPKEAWLDDQGLRMSGTRLAFKQRF